jgi:hypothetical protein
MPDPYIVRLRERPELDAHELLVLRRVGPGQVEYQELLGVKAGQPRWAWKRTDPAVTLEPGQGVIAQVPTDALPALREAVLHAAAGLFPPPASEAEVRVLREVLEHERGRVNDTLEHVGALLARFAVLPPEGWRPQ